VSSSIYEQTEDQEQAHSPDFTTHLKGMTYRGGSRPFNRDR
jgi:hypothetical protein